MQRIVLLTQLMIAPLHGHGLIRNRATTLFYNPPNDAIYDPDDETTSESEPEYGLDIYHLEHLIVMQTIFLEFLWPILWP